MFLIRERINQDIRGLTSILFSNESYAFLKMREMIGHVVFNTYFARESRGLILSIVRGHNSLLLWVLLLFLFLFRRRNIFLILLVLSTNFLRRVHKVDRSGRKSSQFGTGVQ